MGGTTKEIAGLSCIIQISLLSLCREFKFTFEKCRKGTKKNLINQKNCMKKKDKVRIYWSSYQVSCATYFSRELTAEEFRIFVVIFNDYKFYDFVSDPCVNFHRVRVNQYELTLQKDIVGRFKLIFKIINV